MNNTEKNSDRSGSRKNNESNKNPGWWWLYFFLLVLLLTIPSLFKSYAPVKEISWQQFEREILNRKAVEKIVVVNNENAEVYIKKEFANDPRLKMFLNLQWAKPN